MYRYSGKEVRMIETRGSRAVPYRARSWGHRIALFTPPASWTDSLCHIRRCTRLAEYVLDYEYVTGRKGRVGTRRMVLCVGHAQRVFGRYPSIRGDSLRSSPTSARAGVGVDGRS